MLGIFVTLLVSHYPIGWLNAIAPLNMKLISVTFLVAHLPMGWLNTVASLNMLDILDRSKVESTRMTVPVFWGVSFQKKSSFVGGYN
jgi:hypothetical protein